MIGSGLLTTARAGRQAAILRRLAFLGLLGLSHGWALAQDASSESEPSGADSTVSETVSTLEALAPGSGTSGSGATAPGVPGTGVLSYFSESPDHFTQQEGEALYRTTCQACHMPDGEGAEGAGTHPPLSGNPKLLSKHYIVSVLLTGYHSMPRFGDQMSDEQIAAVSNFVRNAFGNDFPGEVTAEDVAELRPPESLQAESGGH